MADHLETEQPGARRVTLILNPIKVGDVDALSQALRSRCHERGWPAPHIVATSEHDNGGGQCTTALAAGCDLILVAGGDGTVRAVAQALVGTGVPLGLIPSGTGNLLARNLDIPLTPDEALTVALHGAPRTIDVAILDDTMDGGTARTTFTVMAGIGVDAAMMRDAPDALKATVGWPAYLVGGVRSLRRARAHVTVQLDGRTTHRHTARTVLVGNCGRLQGGLDLLPGADPGDGLLDIAVIAARRPRDLIGLLLNARRGKPNRGRHLITYRAEHVVVRSATRQPRQADGDLVDNGHVLAVTVQPAALVVQVPH